jgi:polyhydroxyalkanoate synthesis regulator phasin
MIEEKPPIKLTDDRQRQINNATSKSTTKLNDDLVEPGELANEELDQVVGGAKNSGHASEQ